jgi:hypothetical protein
MPVILLGGTILPLAMFPEPLRWLARLISLSWLQDFFRSTASGPIDWTALGLAIALSLIYAVAGIAVFHAMLNRARMKATLELL